MNLEIPLLITSSITYSYQNLRLKLTFPQEKSKERGKEKEIKNSNCFAHLQVKPQYFDIVWLMFPEKHLLWDPHLDFSS